MGICCHKWGKFVLSPCHLCDEEESRNKPTNIKKKYYVNDKVEDDKIFFPKKEQKNDGLRSKNKFSIEKEFVDDEYETDTFSNEKGNSLEQIKFKKIDIIKVLTIKEEENNIEYIKLKEHNEKKNNIIIYKDKSINLEITTINFNELILYSSNKYDYILSFLNNRGNNIEIINTFKKTNYIMKKICSKDEILKECEYIESSDLLLTNHFRKEINRILSRDLINHPVSETSISESSLNSINQLRNDLINKSGLENSFEECLICPISHEIMKDPVITPYGQTFDRVNIVKIIEKDGICPLTRKKLEEKDLIPNYGLKQIIDNYNKKWI